MSSRRRAARTRDPVPVFAALGDPTRLELVARLSDGRARSISALTSDFRLTRQAITKHLRVLEEAGIVSSRRNGRESRFHYEPGAIEEVQDYLGRVSEQWNDALSRLRAFVED